MTATSIRDTLHQYIETADIKKVKAIYTMLEDSIYEVNKWSADFKNELDYRLENYKNNKTSISEKETTDRINHILKTGKKK